MVVESNSVEVDGSSPVAAGSKVGISLFSVDSRSDSDGAFSMTATEGGGASCTCPSFVSGKAAGGMN